MHNIGSSPAPPRRACRHSNARPPRKADGIPLESEIPPRMRGKVSASRNHLRGFLMAAWAGAKIQGVWESLFSLRVLLNASFCTEQLWLAISFYFFYFHHADGKHPIIAEVIVE